MLKTFIPEIISTMYESNTSVLRKQFKNGFALRKFFICVISFVALLAISVLYSPALQDHNFLVGENGAM
jgi:hypothetical protein